jgi:D-sedoheptulose 7-phosphate isomerase
MMVGSRRDPAGPSCRSGTCARWGWADLLGGVARTVLSTDAREPQATPSSIAAPPRENGNAALVERYLTALRQVSATVDAASLGGLVETVVEALRSGRGVFLAGNGGSAATVTHMAGDWSRAAVLCGIRPVRVCGLTDNLASLTGLANDIGYSRALAERLLESAQTGDLLVVLSVSGASPNLIDLARAGREAGLSVVALLGLPGPIASLVDSWAAVGTGDYGLVEDLHLAVNHMVIRALSDEALPGCCPTELERCAAGGAAIPGAVG